MSSQEESERLDRFRELCEERKELWRELSDDLKPGWGIELPGRFRIPTPFASTGWSWVYAGIDIVLLVLGINFVFLGQPWRELGIALIVGALFALGAFVGQILSVQLTEEIYQYHFLWLDALLQRFVTRRDENNEQLRVLRDESEEIAEQIRARHLQIE